MHRRGAQPRDSGRPRVLILGGYGAIGRHLAARLEQGGLEPVIAGRSEDAAAALAAQLPSARTQIVDVGDLDQVAAAASDVRAVVNCTGNEDSRVAAAALTTGADVVDISATSTYLRQLEALDGLARERGRTILASVGLAPGLSNLAAAALAARLESPPQAIDITVLLGLGERHGGASLQWTLGQVGKSFPDPLDGHSVRAFSEPRRVQLPGEERDSVAYRVDSADQDVMTRQLDVPVTTRYCFDPPLATRAAALLARVRRSGALLAAASARLPQPRLGSDRWSLLVEASPLRWEASGRSQSHGTAAVAALAVQRLLAESRPGTHHLHELATLDDLAADLRGAGIALDA